MVRTPGWARIVDGVLRRDCRLRAVARLDLFAQGPAAQEDDAQQYAWQRRAQTAARNGGATFRREITEGNKCREGRNPGQNAVDESEARRTAERFWPIESSLLPLPILWPAGKNCFQC